MRDDAPTGWSTVGLPEVAEINPRNVTVPPTDDQVVSFVSMAAVQGAGGGLDPTTQRTWAEVRRGYTRFENGDVLFAKITPCMENGKIAVAEGLQGGVGAGSTEFHVIRPSAAILPLLLKYYLLQDRVRRDARASMSGTAGQLRVPGLFLREHRFLLPPMAEQHRIVAALESYLSRLDAATAALDRVQRNLARFRASVLHAAVTGRLVPTEAELARAEGRDYEPASVLLERILAERRQRWEEEELAKIVAKGKPPKDDRWKAKYKEPVAPETEGLGELTEGWCWASLEALTDPIRVICYGILMPKENVPDGVPYVKVRDMRLGRLDVSQLQRTAPTIAAKYARASLVPGDLLLAIRGTYGRVVEVPPELDGGNITQDTARLALHCELHRRYIAAALLSPVSQSYFKRVARGVAVKGVNISDVRSTPVALPPQAEQARIIRQTDRLISDEDAVLQYLGDNLTRIARLRQSILRWAFEGRLVDQNPDDEPAAVLLERIRAERAAQSTTRRQGKRQAGATQERLL